MWERETDGGINGERKWGIEREVGQSHVRINAREMDGWIDGWMMDEWVEEWLDG